MTPTKTKIQTLRDPGFVYLVSLSFSALGSQGQNACLDEAAGRGEI